MKPLSIWQQVSPTVVTIDGVEIRMLFTLRAAAILEDALQTDYISMVRELLQAPEEKGLPAPPPMRLTRQAVIVHVLMQEAGEDVSMEEIKALPMEIFTQLCQGMIQEILCKTPTGKSDVKKNGQGKRPGTNG